MPEQWDDDGQRMVGGLARPGARETEADERDAEADEREAEADRRELRIDARELVLDRWEQDIAARAAELGMLDEIEDHRREQRRDERAADGHARRYQAELRRDAAIERDIRRGDRRHRAAVAAVVPPATVAELCLPGSFGELGAALGGETPLRSVLGLVLVAAVDSVAECAAATVALSTKGHIEVAAATAPWAAELDERQAALGVGPVVAAMTADRVRTVDLGDDDRWPELAAVDEARGRAAMAFVLRVAGREAGVLTVYGVQGGRFGPEAAATVEFLAGLASVAMVRSYERLTYEAQAQAWQSALASRDAIGQAKGMLMAQRSITAEEAFEVLRESSQRLNRKLRDIAVHLMEHGRMPSA